MPQTTSNLFLSSLSPEPRARIRSIAEAVPLPLRTFLYHSEVTPKYAFLITSGLASVVGSVPNGGGIEVGLVGKEGLTGTLQLLGPARVPTNCFMQIEGSGLRVPLAALREIFLDSPEVRGRVLEFVQEQILTVSQIAVCGKLHEAQARLARWMLMVQDRIQADVLPLTQEFLAEMLGSRRTTVALAAAALQRTGAIRYRRGNVRVLDREKLEEVCCSCYPIAQRLLQGLYQADAQTK